MRRVYQHRNKSQWNRENWGKHPRTFFNQAVLIFIIYNIFNHLKSQGQTKNESLSSQDAQQTTLFADNTVSGQQDPIEEKDDSSGNMLALLALTGTVIAVVATAGSQGASSENLTNDSATITPVITIPATAEDSDDVEGVDEGTDEGVDDGTDEGLDEGTDDNIDDSTDEGSDEGTDEGIDESTGEDTDEGSDEGTDGGIDESTGEGTDEGSDEGTDEGNDESTGEGIDEDTDEGTDEGIDEDIDEGTDEDIDEGTDEGLDGGTEEGIDEGTGESTEEDTDEGTDGGTEEDTDEDIDEGTEEGIDENENNQTNAMSMNQDNSIFREYAVIEATSYDDTYTIEDFFTGDGSNLTISVDDPDSIFISNPTIDGSNLSFTLSQNTELFDSAVITLSDDTGSQAFSVTAGSSQMIAHTTFNASALSSVEMALPLSALYAFNPTTSLYTSTNNINDTGNYNLSFNGSSISGELTSSDLFEYWLWENTYPYDNYQLSLSENGTRYDLTVSLDGTIVHTETSIDTLSVSLSGIDNPYLQLSQDNESIVISSDPQLADQWHLFNSEIIEAWPLSTGEGVTIGVVEGYFEETHEDLEGNVSVTIDSNHASGSTPDYHATAVAGVIGASGGNGLGVIGTAPDADIVSLTDMTNNLFEVDPLIALYSNSWGPTDGLGGTPTVWWDYIIDSAEDAALVGDTILFANGNGGEVDDQSAYDGIVSSPFTLSISAVSDWGEVSEYSEVGSNITTATYSNGGVNGITTTDLNNNYTNDFGGTSSATPFAAGIAALMESVNPNLTYRDYMSIFATTSLQIDPIDSSWSTNLAGIDTSYYYGFGLINALSAVEAAQDNSYMISDHALVTQTISSGDFTAYSGSNTVLDITPIGGAANSSVTLEEGEGDSITFQNSSYVVEQVELTIVSIDYTTNNVNLGDENLQITLTHELNDDSFSSTLLFATTTNSAQNYDGWSALSVQHFGESLEGTWTVSLYDTLNNAFFSGDQFTVGLDFFYHDETITVA